ARLAGLPPQVVARAEEVLSALEKGEQGSAVAKLADDLPLFAALATPKPKAAEVSAVEQKLKDVSVDDLTPRQALEVLYALKGLL
ncbi:MAG TPA: hypothetical protein VLL76_10730, partial [Candidatus Omnitrophota bacterium]|nr:hypothetical protein [Candidatus Omnitrophota bacterium]